MSTRAPAALPAAPLPGFADRAEQALLARGGRRTKSRRALLELIGALERPLAPGELHEELQARGVRIDRVSVWRNVSALVELGLVHRVLGQSAVRPCSDADADRAEPARCHHAIVCNACGTASEFHSAAVERALREVRRSTGFRVQGHLLELRGLCPRCAA